jgi:hypothetical protein
MVLDRQDPPGFSTAKKSAKILSATPGWPVQLWTLRAVRTRSAEPAAPRGPATGPKFTNRTVPYLAGSAKRISKFARPLLAPSETFGLARSARPAT